MKNRFLGLFLSLILVLTLPGNIRSGEEDFLKKSLSDKAANSNTIMHPDKETLLGWIQDYENAPLVHIDEDLKLGIPLRGSYSLLSHLDYTPSERNQGYCGNCWAWAGTGVMGIALDFEESILDRLSIQYLNSCKSGSYACCGGNLPGFADFYTSTGQTIPWSNTNASFQDAGRRCSDGSSLVSCGSISTSPNFLIVSIDDQSITTHDVGRETAIANIKNVLHQGKAIYFSYCLATEADWDNFRSFWNNQGESIIWNPDFSCGHTWESNQGGCHAVLCVGYNDNDPDNSYWIMVNSWGTVGGGRPNGIFRLDMDMNYDCNFYYSGWYWSFNWQTLDIAYSATNQPDFVLLSIMTDPVEPEPGETVNVYVTIENQGTTDAGMFQLDWYADPAFPPLPGDSGDQREQVTSLAAGDTHTMSTTWSYNPSGIYNMYARVDTDQEISESDETNNILGPQNILVGICECDLNNDGTCDMQDWLLFGQDWGRADCGTPPGSGNPPNDCECDLNHDGTCDMQDWLMFGEDWGRADCPLIDECSGELYYDTGIPDHYWGGGSAGLGMAVRFSPPGYPWTFDLAGFWPWSNSETLDIEIHVWDDDGPGALPGSNLIPPFIHHCGGTEQWEDVNLPTITIDSGDFYIGWVQHDSSTYFNGDDNDPSSDGRSYLRDNAGLWNNFLNFWITDNLMIRQSCRSIPGAAGDTFTPKVPGFASRLSEQ